MCTNILFVQGKLIANYQGITMSQFLVDKLPTSCKRINCRFLGFLTQGEPCD